MAEGTITSKVTLSNYRYIPKNVELHLRDKEPLKFIDGGVTYFNIIHNYLQARLPVIQMGFELPVDLINEIYDDLDAARFKLDIVEERMDPTTSDVAETRLYLQKTFSIVPTMERSIFIVSDNPTTAESIDEMRKLQHFEMYLIDLEPVQWFEAKRDADFDDITYGALLQSCFVMRDIPPQTVLATPPLQNGELKKGVMPLDTLIGNIRHINRAYGIYDNSPIIYYDYKRLFCLSRTRPNVELEDADDFGTVVCVLRNPEKPEHFVQGSADDEENRVHVMNIQTEPTVRDNAIHDTSSKLSTLTSVNGTGTVAKTTLDDNSAKAQYIYSINGLTRDQYMNESMIGLDVSFTVPGINIRMLAPHKAVQFDADTSFRNLYLSNKIFRIVGWSVNIQRQGTTEYMHQVNIHLQEPIREGLNEDGTTSQVKVPERRGLISSNTTRDSSGASMRTL